jgi:VanZ like family/Concanavalin A-like lectin/glucanases superfamily
MLLRSICACVLLGILGAGLWPFRAPRNEVSWSSQGNGLLFGNHGSIVSASPFEARASEEDNACSLEIWLEPSRVDWGGTILAFYWPENRVVPFALRQWRGGVVLEHESRDHFAQKTEIYVGDVFRSLKPTLVTITSGSAGTATYVNGRLVKTVSNLSLSNRDLTGQFVVGNGPSTADNWSGLLKGLAVYDRELSAKSVSQDFLNLTMGSQLASATKEGLIAQYLFDEGTGNVVRNQVNSATDLQIPERFFLLHEQFLERPWNEFRPGWHYWKDVAINIVGFIPLGFFFGLYFSEVRKAKHSAALTIAFGFAVSLTIEVLQAFLPTRDSGMTDLITNTLGTAVGVMALRHRAVQAVIAVAGHLQE